MRATQLQPVLLTKNILFLTPFSQEGKWDYWQPWQHTHLFFGPGRHRGLQTSPDSSCLSFLNLVLSQSESYSPLCFQIQTCSSALPGYRERRVIFPAAVRLCEMQHFRLTLCPALGNFSCRQRRRWPWLEGCLPAKSQFPAPKRAKELAQGISEA